MEAVRRFGRSMWVLLAGILLFHAGWYMLLPYLAVLLTSRRGLTPAEAGVVLGTQSVSLLTGSLLGGALADRFGRRPVLVAGLILRAGGIGGLGMASGLPGLLLAAGITGLGGGLYGPAAKAGITRLAPAEARNTAFSLRGMAASLGISAGPVAGAVLVRGPVPLLFGTAAALHGALALATWLFFREPGAHAGRRTAPWQKVLADLPYVGFSAAATLAWMLFAQLNLAVPLFASRILGLEAQIGLLWTISSLAVVLFQTAVTRAVLSRLHPLTAMGLGTAALGTGLGLVAFARDFTGLLGAVLVFVAGEMLLMPTADTVVSLLAPSGAVGSYFGIASFAWGMGETLGNVLGGVLLEYTFASGRPGLPWVVHFAAGIIIGGCCLLLRRWPELERRLRAAPA